MKWEVSLTLRAIQTEKVTSLKIKLSFSFAVHQVPFQRQVHNAGFKVVYEMAQTESRTYTLEQIRYPMV